MLGVAALATSAMDLLQSLTSKKTTSSSSNPTTGLLQDSSFQLGTQAEIVPTTTVTSGTSSGSLSASTMSALLDAQSQAQVSPTSRTRSDALKSLFAQLDGDGDGSITQAEFEDKLGAGGTNTANADKVFARLDADGDGKVGIDELGKALKGAGRAHHAGHGGGGDGAGDGTDATGATTTTTVNPDGSTTTAITYADGSSVTSTSAAPASSSTASAARNSYNAIEQMIAKQAKQIASATSPLAMTV